MSATEVAVAKKSEKSSLHYRPQRSPASEPWAVRARGVTRCDRWPCAAWRGACSLVAGSGQRLAEAFVESPAGRMRALRNQIFFWPLLPPRSYFTYSVLIDGAWRPERQSRDGARRPRPTVARSCRGGQRVPGRTQDTHPAVAAAPRTHTRARETPVTPHFPRPG